jgi:MSHA biogenesis protein MshP
MKLTLYYKKQKGLSLVAAIFILLALSVIGFAMVTLNSTTAITSALNIEQKRAYYAAKSGIEWASAVILKNDQLFVDSCNGLVAGEQWSTAEGFIIKVESCVDLCPGCCDAVPGDCALNPRVTTVSISAQKGNMGDTFYVFRQIEATLSYDGS